MAEVDAVDRKLKVGLTKVRQSSMTDMEIVALGLRKV